MSKREKGQSTRLVEGGRRKEWRGRLVNVPVERASTILFDSVDELGGSRPGLGSYRYGLQGTATHWALAEALTTLEPGAAGTALFPTGLAAITGPLLTLLSPGDELLVPDNVYGPTRKFCETILKRLNIVARYYDPLVGPAIAELIGETTRAILLESPGSLTMEVQDVPGICAVARERGSSPCSTIPGRPPPLPGHRRRGRHHDPCRDQICWRTCRSDAGRGDGNGKILPANPDGCLGSRSGGLSR